jgi:hypothetical protein
MDCEDATAMAGCGPPVIRSFSPAAPAVRGTAASADIRVTDASRSAEGLQPTSANAIVDSQKARITGKGIPTRMAKPRRAAFVATSRTIVQQSTRCRKCSSAMRSLSTHAQDRSDKP